MARFMRHEKMQWYRMRHRCKSHPHYAGRVFVCKEWDNFDSFITDMGAAPSTSHSIDRIDGNGPYSRKNCRWATRTEQARNRSNNVRISAFGETKTAPEWADDARCAVGLVTLRARIRRGWPCDLAVSASMCHVFNERSSLGAGSRRKISQSLSRYHASKPRNKNATHAS